jgi:hypothetical protein
MTADDPPTIAALALTDALRAALDDCGIRLRPPHERRLIVELIRPPPTRRPIMTRTAPMLFITDDIVIPADEASLSRWFAAITYELEVHHDRDLALGMLRFVTKSIAEGRTFPLGPAFASPKD